jgi:glycosyltransferase involved in cell wall biosynthesis
MKISIVTLSYNQEHYLREALDSVLEQHYPELDYIVVDPGSTDGSRALIERYADSLAQVVFDPDKGAADGLNKGFALATGDVYGFLNADDVLYSGSLERVARFFEENPQCDIVFGSGHKIDGEGKQLLHFRGARFTVNRYFYGGAEWLQQATFFRAEAFRRSPRFNVENGTCWDGELFVSMVNQGARAGYLAADLAGFRIHDASISGSGRLNERFKKDSLSIFRKIKGRDWNRMDNLRCIAYRATGHVSRIAKRWFS